MKADSYGTPVEQARARMGWKTATEARAAGVSLTRRCAQCNFMQRRQSVGGWGQTILTPFCENIAAAGENGHATRESATCNRWEQRP